MSDWKHFEERKERLATRENEDEEGADSSDDADDLAHVRHKHGGEHSDTNPDHSEDDSAAALKGMRDDSSPISLKTQNQVEDDGPVSEKHVESSTCRREKLRWENAARLTQRRPQWRPQWRRSPPQEQNNRVDGDDGYSKEQSGNDHHHVVAWIGHQNIRGDLLSKGHEAVHTCEEREGALWLVLGDSPMMQCWLGRGKHLSGCRPAGRRAWRAWRCTPSGRASGSPYCCRWQCRLHGTAGESSRTKMIL